RARADLLDDIVDAPHLVAPREGKRKAPAMSVQAETDEVQPANAKPGIERSPLRKVRDPGLGISRWTSEDGDAALRRRQQTENRLEEGGLPGPVRAEHGDELAGHHGEVDVAD